MVEANPVTKTGRERKTSRERPPLGEASMTRKLKDVAVEARRIQVTYLDEYPKSNPTSFEFTFQNQRVAVRFDFEDREISTFGTAAVTIADAQSIEDREKRRDIVIRIKRGNQVESGVKDYIADNSSDLYKPAGYYQRVLADKDNLRPVTPDEIEEIWSIFNDLYIPWEHLKSSSI